MNPSETYNFVVGPKSLVKHWFGGSVDVKVMGDGIMSDLKLISSQHSFKVPLTVGDSSRQTIIKKNVWEKIPAPIFGGGKLGSCFDICVLVVDLLESDTPLIGLSADFYPKREDMIFAMVFSWRPKASIAVVYSKDGVIWGEEPVIILSPAHHSTLNWEMDVNRPFVFYHNLKYHMWYTGQNHEKMTSMIGYASSKDGLVWDRRDEPVLRPEVPWEDNSIMCSHVIFDESKQLYRMWYSAGHQFEPIAIGHAFSCDGINWNRTFDSPIFQASKEFSWEKDRVSCPTVVYHGDYYYMFYIGFQNVHRASIGIARSKDGISSWQRHPDNPILEPSIGSWDSDAVYKPSVAFHDGRWMLWYNGRKGHLEQIGLATLSGHDFGFEMGQAVTKNSYYKDIQFDGSKRQSLISIDIQVYSEESNLQIEQSIKIHSYDFLDSKVYLFCKRHSLTTEMCRQIYDNVEIKLRRSDGVHVAPVLPAAPIWKLFFETVGTANLDALVANMEAYHTIIKSSFSNDGGTLEGYLAVHAFAPFKKHILFLL